MKPGKLKLQELIYIGIYTALYFLVVCISTGVLKLTVPVFNNLFIPGLNAVLAGIVYLLLLEKVPRLGGITIMGTVTGLFFLLTGHFPLAFVPGIFFSALADVIQYKSKLPDKMRLTVSYLVFGFSLTGPLLPLWFMKNAYEQSLVARGKSQAYIDQVFKPITTASFVMVVVTIVIGSLVGIWLARRIYQKHFYRLEAE